MIRAGLLRHRVTLQSPSYVQNTTTGEQALTWTGQGTVWAEVAPLSAREFIAAQAVQSQVDTRLTIRYRSDVLPTWRALHASKVYQILGILADKDSNLEYLTFACASGPNDSGE
jgi:SPP1 family predicted phage head-tail adaptor